MAITNQKVCDHCGSVYEVTYTKVIFRDQDSADCDVCGKKLESWSSSRIPHFRLIKRGTAPNEK